MNELTGSQERDYRATVQIRDRAEDISVYVATWQDQGHDGGDRRHALAEAVAAIDDMQLAAHELRQSLVGQEREFDDAAMRRSAELLERIRKERES
jgi:hypothetical protein